MAKSVETQYGDNWYPSRLAARWAVFFDLIGIRFQHRPTTWTMTDLDNREWTPDFVFTELWADLDDEERRSKTSLVVRERPASNWDIETAAHYRKCQYSEHVYVFSGLPTEGGIGVLPLEGKHRTYPADFGQCPFCGDIFLRDSQRGEDEVECYRGHYGCIAEERYAEQLGIDPAFMDFTDRDKPIASPTASPMLQIAKMAARQVRFESKESVGELAGIAKSIKVLKETRCFASPELTGFIEWHGKTLAKDERCPRFSPTFRYIHHLHKKSG